MQVRILPRGWFGRGYGRYGTGMGFGNPYPFCRYFPWLPRWWWTGMYGYTTPYVATPQYYGLPKEQEITMLKEQAKALEEMLRQISQRLKEMGS
jgi:hypothetical protein